MLAICLGNRFAAVGDIQHQPIALIRDTNHQLAAVVAIGNGVRDQVVQHARRSLTVRLPFQRMMRALDAHPLVVERQAMLGQHFLNHRRNIERGDFHSAAVLQQIVVQQLLDQGLQFLPVLVDQPDDFTLALVELAGHAVGQQRGPFPDAGQRCFQLVRHMAQKLLFLGFQLR